MRQNNSDRLRMLILHELAELLRIDLAEIIKVHALLAHGFHEPVEQPLRGNRSVSFNQQFLRVFQATFDIELLRSGILIKLFEHLIDLLGLYRFQPRNGLGDSAALLLRQMLQDRRAFYRTEREQDDSRLLQARQTLITCDSFLRHRLILFSSPSHPGAGCALALLMPSANSSTVF